MRNKSGIKTPNRSGAKKRTGKISNAAISKIIGIPEATLTSWRDFSHDDWRHKIYWLLKSFTKEELIKQHSKALLQEIEGIVYADEEIIK